MPNPLENAVAKVAGTAGVVEARFRGLRGVFTALAEQHHEVGSLLARAESATDPEKRQELWNEIRKELISHEQAELIDLYPLLESNELTRGISRDHASDVEALEPLIQEIARIGVASSEWAPAIRRLIATVKAHVKLEETKLFPAAQDALGETVAKELEAPLLRTKALAKEALG